MQPKIIKYDDGFYTKTFHGNVLEQIEEAELIAAAKCFKTVFNDPNDVWKEDWTLGGALNELEKPLKQTKHRFPIFTILKKDDNVIGFGLGVAMDVDYMILDDMPHSLDNKRRYQGLKNMKYHIKKIRKQEKVLDIREIGVLRAYRKLWVPNILLPISEKALELKCIGSFFWTIPDSKIFDYAIGVDWQSIYTFKTRNAVVMYGATSQIYKFSIGLSQKETRRETFRELIKNKEDFFKNN